MSVQKEKRKRLLAVAEELANDFATRAAEHDQNNTFPFENVARMKETGYTALVLPEEYGGSGADLVDFCLCQERLAQGCGATALAINMHLFGLGSLVERGDLVRSQSQQFVQAVGRDRQIIGGGITEPETGGNWGLFVSRAVKDGDSYVLNGRKVFTSLAPVIDLFMVMVTVQDPDAGLLGGTFLLPKGTPGLEIIETWNAMGMRATASHDLVITDCRVPLDHAIRLRPIGEILPEDVSLFAWFSLSIASIYTGVAMAALNFAKEFANRHRPLPLPRPIKYLPGIQFTVAEAEILLAATRAYTLETAKAWVNREDFSGEDGLRRVCMPKYFATNNAIRIVDLAMEIVGAVGIFKKHPLERYYRDVRAGTNHPFSNARTRELVGKNALGIKLLEMPRW
ncbi:MAG TPA: acyl-CoA dehydrogenase family protein [Candidatus Binatia bacterium]|nr:acyl-CoA dehydrogenase family protein [Candidatus Binatia bacterium]